MNEDIFSFMLSKIIEEESESLKNILSPLAEKEHWKCSKAFRIEFQSLVEGLCVRFVHRASLFGQYRSDPDMTKTQSNNKKRARPHPPMECREADFNLAWQTLEQDTK
jgi:hypothetical protein